MITRRGFFGFVSGLVTGLVVPRRPATVTLPPRPAWKMLTLPPPEPESMMRVLMDAQRRWNIARSAEIEQLAHERPYWLRTETMTRAEFKRRWAAGESVNNAWITDDQWPEEYRHR